MTTEQTVKERPIGPGTTLSTAEMVRAALDGRKNQVRAVVKPQPAPNLIHHGPFYHVPSDRRGRVWHDTVEIGAGTTVHTILCPFGQPGDRLYCKETWALPADCDPYAPSNFIGGWPIWYAADDALDESRGLATNETRGRWRSPIHMPRWASRLTLDVIRVRVERVQDISEADARAEGVLPCNWSGTLNGEPAKGMIFDPRMAFQQLWDSIHGAGAWDRNDWVRVIEFKPEQEKAR